MVFAVNSGEISSFVGLQVTIEVWKVAIQIHVVSVPSSSQPIIFITFNYHLSKRKIIVIIKKQFPNCHHDNLEQIKKMCALSFQSAHVYRPVCFVFEGSTALRHFLF